MVTLGIAPAAGATGTKVLYSWITMKSYRHRAHGSVTGLVICGCRHCFRVSSIRLNPLGGFAAEIMSAVQLQVPSDILPVSLHRSGTQVEQSTNL